MKESSDHGYKTVDAAAEEGKKSRAVQKEDLSAPAPISRSDSDQSMLVRERRFAPEESTLESLNLEDSESVTWRKYRLRRHFQSEHHRVSDAQAFAGRNWVLVFIVGVTVGCIGSFVLVLSHALLTWKFNVTHDLIDSGKWAAAFVSYLCFSLFFVGVAVVMGYVEPNSTGSGISEVKVYLNGVNLVGFLKPRAVIAKAIGICFSVASGLPIGTFVLSFLNIALLMCSCRTGKKAPMVHVGAAVASILSQGRKKTFGFDTSWSVHTDFQNDKMVTDSLTYGIAAGIAAVFR